MRPWILLAALALAACGGEATTVRPAPFIPVPSAALPANLAAIQGLGTLAQSTVRGTVRVRGAHPC